MFLAVFLRHKVLVVNLNDSNDQDAWKGQPYDADCGVKRTYSPQNKSPTNWPETQMLT